MSDYLNTADSGSDDEQNVKELSEADVIAAREEAARLKAEGNEFFSRSEFDEALVRYSGAIKALKNANLPKDALILLNRSATYLALKRYVPAMNDANQAIEIDPTNWKGHWRQGVALMAMSKRIFRTKQAIEAFQKCAACETLPANKKAEVASELAKARARFEKQEAETPPADLSRCAPS